MGFIQPTPLPYDPQEWAAKSFPEKARMVCHAWAMHGYGTPSSAYVFYALKVVFYIGIWTMFCSLSPALGELEEIASWWLHPIAFQKAIAWSMLFEVLGFGCGSGPLTGRYMPPIGGFLHFLRPGTTKLPLFAKAPLIGGIRRTWLDASLYLALVASLVALLIHPDPGLAELLPVIGLTAVLGLLDKTIFLAARSEHYWVILICVAFATNWVAGAKIVWLALWFWAGFSKLNHHFAAVVGVMTSNGPLTFTGLRRAVYRNFPSDLRPSRLAAVMGMAGTALELSIPLILVFGNGGPITTVGLLLMLMLHGYITMSIPMGVPIEWNFLMVYGGLFLFAANASVSLGDVGPWPINLFLLVMAVGIPLLGNFVPHRISFLPAMRYYAGNWAYSVWLFRGDSYRKLDRHILKSSAWTRDQLERFYDSNTASSLMSKIMAFRLMHLHGRALHDLLPLAVDELNDYEWTDGEIIAGSVLGWNFGDGHLHNEGLLSAVQAQCNYEPGELRCIFVEAQPLGGDSLAYRIQDASTGLVTAGEVPVSQLLERQPWPSEVNPWPTSPPEST
ncbi:MAG: DUF3556 domain-containing protein [Nannocystaceae bacterium]